MKRTLPLRKTSLCIALALCASAVHADPNNPDFDALRTKWTSRGSNVPALPANDPDVAMQAAAAASQAQSYWDTMDRTATRTALWSSLPMNNNGTSGTTTNNDGNIVTSISRLVTIINAYKSSGSTLYQNPEVPQAMFDAIDFILNTYYSTTGTGYGNWWNWQIGIPNQLLSVMGAWYGTLGDTRIANMCASIDHFLPVTTYRANLNGTVSTIAETGTNLSNKAVIFLLRGMYGKNAGKIQAAHDSVPPILTTVTGGDGFYADGTFIQHSVIPYLGGYGSPLIDDMNKLLYMFDDSSDWPLTVEQGRNKVYDWIVNSYAPTIYDGAIFDSQRGRNESRQFQPDHVAGRATIGAIANLSWILPADQAPQVKSLVKGWAMRDNFFGSSYYTPYATDEAGVTSVGVSKNTIAAIKGIVNDPNIAAAAEPLEVRTFPSGDRMVARGTGFAYNVTMFSYNRISALEAGNKENLKGWWTGAGATTLYNADRAQFADNYWATIDKTRLPGTTTDHSMRTTTYSDWTNWSNTRDVTGSVQLNRQYGAAGMDFGMGTVTGSTLTGKKAWFTFGDAIVAVGSGVTGGTGSVETIVENLALNANGDNALTVADPADSSKTITKPASLPWSETMAGLGWAHIAGNASSGSDVGYVFPDLPSVSGLRESRTDNWKTVNNSGPANGTATNYTRNFLSLALGHGSSPANAGYTYIVLPNATPASTQAFAAANPIRVLERSTDATAVEHKDLGVTGAVFWNRAAKTVNRDGFALLTSDKPALVTLQQTGSSLQLAVSDPVQVAGPGNALSGTINLEFGRAASAVVSSDPEVTVTQLSPTVKLQVSTGATAGKSINAAFTLAQSSASLSPVADTYVRDGTYAATNFGTAGTMAVKTEVINYDRNALMKFDLSGINGRIASATLRMTTATVGTAPNMVHNMYQTTSDNWTETGVTWATKPADGKLVASWNVPASNTAFDVDITSAAIAAANGNKVLSLQIEAAANYGSAGSVDYASKNNTNAANRPVLTVTYY